MVYIFGRCPGSVKVVLDVRLRCAGSMKDVVLLRPLQLTLESRPPHLSLTVLKVLPMVVERVRPPHPSSCFGIFVKNCPQFRVEKKHVPTPYQCFRIVQNWPPGSTHLSSFPALLYQVRMHYAGYNCLKSS